MRSFALITVILLIAAAAIFVLKQHTENNPPQPVASAPAPAAVKPQNPPQDWNETGVAWQTFDAGMKQAQQEQKPVCLVFYAEWCPHCRNYGKVFHDAGIIEKSKRIAGDLIQLTIAAGS